MPHTRGHEVSRDIDHILNEVSILADKGTKEIHYLGQNVNNFKGLYKNEKMMFLPFLIATPILFFLGGCMVYYIVIPLAWDFFISFQITGIDGSLPIELEPRISEYLSLVMKLIFAFGICFELPVLLLLLTKSGIMSPQDLANKRKYAIPKEINPAKICK